MKQSNWLMTTVYGFYIVVINQALKPPYHSMTDDVSMTNWLARSYNDSKGPVFPSFCLAVSRQQHSNWSHCCEFVAMLFFYFT